MRRIFETAEINGVQLKNRLVRSATWEGMCYPDGRPTEKLIKFYRVLARGGVALIITGYTFVRPDGKHYLGQMDIHTDDFAEDMKKMAVSGDKEDCMICLQLVHAGGHTTRNMAGRQPPAPSSVKAAQYGDIVPVEMTKKDIEEMVKAFGEGARRAKAFGLNAVQLHAADGYLCERN